MKVCSYFNGGDCVTIEQYVFALYAECEGKITKKVLIFLRETKKIANNTVNLFTFTLSSGSG